MATPCVTRRRVEAGLVWHARPDGLLHGVIDFDHQKGRTICDNSLTLPAAHFEDTVLDAIEGTVLSPSVVEAAVARAVAVLQTPEDAPTVESRRTSLERLEQELRQLTAAIASGGELTALLDAVRVREAQRAALISATAVAGALTTHAREKEPAQLRAQLLERLADWRSLLRGQVTQAQQILRRLLAGPILCAPQPERCYRLTGMATLGRLVEGQVPVPFPRQG